MARILAVDGQLKVRNGLRLRFGRLSLVLLTLAVFFAAIPRVMALLRDRARFVDAIESRSRTDFYVLVRIVFPGSGHSRMVAVTAQELRNAIREEYDLPWTDEGGRQADRCILSAWDRTYHLSHYKSVRWIPLGYSEKGIKEAREFLSKYTNAELMADPRLVYGPDIVFVETSGCANGIISFGNKKAPAIAQVLLEREMQPASDDKRILFIYPNYGSSWGQIR